MAQINPYLVFNGYCEEAFNLYKSVFGGEFNTLMRFKDMPTQEGELPIADEILNRVMHITYNIGSTILMGSDSNPAMGDVTFGKNISISVDVKSREEADNVFNGLSDGGQITMPIQNTFWGAYFGMCEDKFGVLWMVNFYFNILNWLNKVYIFYFNLNYK